MVFEITELARCDVPDRVDVFGRIEEHVLAADIDPNAVGYSLETIRLVLAVAEHADHVHAHRVPVSVDVLVPRGEIPVDAAPDLDAFAPHPDGFLHHKVAVRPDRYVAVKRQDAFIRLRSRRAGRSEKGEKQRK